MQTKKAQRKAEQRALVASRLSAAMSAMYANGRVDTWPRETSPQGFPDFWEWLSDYAEREIDYMGAENFGLTLGETRAPSNLAASYRLRTARNRVERIERETGRAAYKGAAMNEARNIYSFPAGPFETARRVLISRARDWLTREEKNARTGATYTATAIYSHGRMGKTFYPERFAVSRVGGFYPKDCSEWPYAERCELALFIEQFNLHVRSIAADAANVYCEEAREALNEKADEARATIRNARESFHALKLELRDLARVNAPNVCAVLRERMRALSYDAYKAARNLSRIRSTIADLGA